MTLLDTPILSRIRRNHGLEHATITILSGRFPARRLAGFSDPDGFFILGDVSAADLYNAATRALARLNNGERHLAVHPGCGTNFVTSGFIAGLLAWLGMAGANDRSERVRRLPLVILLVVLGLVFSQPLGPLIQSRITTSGDPQGLVIQNVFPVQFGKFCLHRVITKG